MPPRTTNLFSHQRFLDSCEVLERRQENMAPLWTSDIFHEVTKFLAQSCKNFIFVFDRFYKISSTSAQNVVPYRAAYHLKRESTRLLCGLLPAPGQWLRVDEWHSTSRVHRHATRLSAPAQANSHRMRPSSSPLIHQ